jgi:glycosidase
MGEPYRWARAATSNQPLACRVVATDYADTPAWVTEAVFYQIFPDRFASSGRVDKRVNLEEWEAPPTVHGFKGGDLGGIIEHLDYLSDLGVNAILLNPVFQSASNHRYHTHDYLRIDPLLGDDALFDELVAACHDRGFRIVLDGVFNHASRGFFQFNDILENGAQSPYIDWFRIRGFPIYPYHPSYSDAPMYEAWWDLPALPEFNTDNPVVADFLLGVAEHWTRRGIDGWRLDVALEIKTPGFWEEFRRRVRAINPEAYIVAEIWHDAAESVNDRERFDGTMNYQYTGRVIAFAAGHRVDVSAVEGQPWPTTPPIDAPTFASAVGHILSEFGQQATLGNLNCFSSHDTSRALTIAGGDEASVRLIALLALTFPGPGHVYYGEELGMMGHKDPLSRGAMPWDDPDSWNRGLLESFRRLISLRRSHAALRGTDYRVMTAYDMVFVVERGRGDDSLVVVANAGDDEAVVELDREVRPQPLWGSATVAGRTVTVPARSGAVLDSSADGAPHVPSAS